MDLITKLFDIDFAAFVPKLPVFLGLMRTLMALALLAGPVTMVILAALYLFKPAPEANYNFGYRTYYGMGSVEAWQFSQKIAGLAFGGVGAGLTVAMLIVILFFIGKTLMQVAIMATVCLLVQVVLILAARIVVASLCRKYFDKDGYRRNPAPRFQKRK
ncbi:MAG: SdpI family protein [Oscillospiraceae bacterium]|nr:SdpI family protein [Oscillospiraceae bacterium]